LIGNEFDDEINVGGESQITVQVDGDTAYDYVANTSGFQRENMRSTWSRLGNIPALRSFLVSKKNHVKSATAVG